MGVKNICQMFEVSTTIFEIAEPSKKSSYKFCFWCFLGEISESKTGKYVYFKFLVLRTP